MPCAGGTAPTATSEIIAAVDMGQAGILTGDSTVWVGVSVTPSATTALQLAFGNTMFAVGPIHVSYPKMSPCLHGCERTDL